MLILLLPVAHLSFSMEESGFGERNNFKYESETTRLLARDFLSQDYWQEGEDEIQVNPYVQFLTSFDQLPEELKERICSYIDFQKLYELAPFFPWPGSIKKKIVHAHYLYLADNARLIEGSPAELFRDGLVAYFEDPYLNRKSYSLYRNLIETALNFKTRSKKYETDCGVSYSDLVTVLEGKKLKSIDLQEALEDYINSTQDQIDFLYHEMKIPRKNLQHFKNMKSSFLAYARADLRGVNIKKGNTCYKVTFPGRCILPCLFLGGVYLSIYAQDLAGPDAPVLETLCRVAGSLLITSSLFFLCLAFVIDCYPTGTSFLYRWALANKEGLLIKAQEKIQKINPRPVFDLV